ncbi:hypothetical protein GWI33_019170 [Rhynchophorus ferrugineus]|uniref:Uncharacterized protein n=1 Tax=Rhynchophorus ferrugineus TaxID=354439 RepID=A0A834HVE6_RHYFE|nr:hypothetical protein GWI33_019170 [Rhynchophorus ferrugineus]
MRALIIIFFLGCLTIYETAVLPQVPTKTDMQVSTQVDGADASEKVLSEIIENVSHILDLRKPVNIPLVESDVGASFTGPSGQIKAKTNSAEPKAP